MENRIVKTELVDWQKINPLQPDNVKVIQNMQHLKNSILKYGFSMPFYVWENKGEIFAIDGHTRKQALLEMQDVPKMLPATFINAKNRKEAIQILIDVYNQRQNAFDADVLIEFIEAEVVDVTIESVNVIINENYEINGNENEKNSSQNNEPSTMIAVTLNDDEALQWNEAKKKLGIAKDKSVIFELLKIYKNGKT